MFYSCNCFEIEMYILYKGSWKTTAYSLEERNLNYMTRVTLGSINQMCWYFNWLFRALVGEHFSETIAFTVQLESPGFMSGISLYYVGISICKELNLISS